MFSRRSFFARILANPEAHALLMNSLAIGEADSARDLDRFARLIDDEVLSAKVYRHFAEETRHARLLGNCLEELGIERQGLPPELDYETYATRFGLGIPRSRLDDETSLDAGELIRFLCGCKAGEERACEEMAGLIADLGDAHPETAAVLREIHGDELRHVSYATEELTRLAERHRGRVVSELRRARRAEARAHRLVTLAFMDRLMALLEAPRWIRFVAARGTDTAFLLRFLFPGGLDQPRIRDAMPVSRPGSLSEPA